jgi:hypothetical protein
MADWTWMFLKNHTCGEYLTGLKSSYGNFISNFIAVAEVDKLNQRKSAISCQCVDYDTGKKFMDDYMCWNMHGEEGCNA